MDSLKQFIKKGVDLYITGSNAYMLSSEIATTMFSKSFAKGEFIISSWQEGIEGLPLRKYYFITDKVVKKPLIEYIDRNLCISWRNRDE